MPDLRRLTQAADALSSLASAGQPDAAGRAIAGLLTYNPSPGIYSRLERAIEAMPANVRTQELPGLLKRYKDGVPGWELKETDLDSVIAGRDVVPREELLARVRERSPVYTHKEVVLGGRGPAIKDQPHYSLVDFGGAPLLEDVPAYQDKASKIGHGLAHGDPQYASYSQGGDDYAEVLLVQPGASGLGNYGNHWRGTPGTEDAVAHARFDTHGDALRINELQSDLGIHNRKMRESGGQASAPAQLASETDAEYAERLAGDGWIVEWDEDGELVTRGQSQLPFPLEDAWSDILIKRLALEAAQKGHRAIEVASPRAIADKVGGNIDNYEHFYGKVVPGALERLGRKMGGLVEDAPTAPGPSNYRNQVRDEVAEISADARMRLPPDVHPHYRQLARAISDNLFPETIMAEAEQLARSLDESGRPSANLMPSLMRLAERDATAMNAWENVRELEHIDTAQSAAPGRRYLMSDEMRRRILQEGIPAAVAVGIGADNLIDRLGQEQR
jgi:hypothetical protein